MKVYRLEFADSRDHGPFNPPQDFNEFLTGHPNKVSPAEAAQAVAVALDVKGPFDMPGPARDSKLKISNVEFRRRFGSDAEVHDLVFGFSSLEQYREWFPHQLERKVLFKGVWLARKPDNSVPTVESGLELRCFEVPDDKVIVGEKQVSFLLDAATRSVKVSMREATA